MNIKIQFGVPPLKVREVKWYDDLMKLPRVIFFDDDYWEWISYDTPHDKHVDYVVTYGKSKMAATWAGLEVPDFDQMFGWQACQQIRCECGAAYDRSFPNVHSYWCPKWEKV